MHGCCENNAPLPAFQFIRRKSSWPLPDSVLGLKTAIFVFESFDSLVYFRKRKNSQ